MHCLDFQVVNTSTAQQSLAIQQYTKALQNLSNLKKERIRVEAKAALMEQVATLTTVNQSATFTATPLLIRAMLEEAAKVRKELEGIVSMTLTYRHSIHMGQINFKPQGSGPERI